MIQFSIISIFPEILENFSRYGLVAKAVESKNIQVDCYNLRDFTSNKHKKTDDRPFGGGPGMVMMPQPLCDVTQFIKEKKEGHVILFSAYAPILSQEKIKQLSMQDHMILVCGRYEGVDQRYIDTYVDEEISIGEYVIMGGETAAQVLIEGVSRMIPGVVGNPESVSSDTFYEEGQFAFPQYTQPRSFRGMDVPEILVNGNHKKIEAWRRENQKGEKNEKNR